MTTLVVVGAGLAGLRTVEKLRTRGFDGQIILVGGEKYLPYDRPPLSKQVLRRERDEPWLRSAEEYEALRVEVRCGRPVTRLDPINRRLWLEDDCLDFDLLVIATGASPRRLPGIGGQVLRTWSDAVALRDSLVPGSSLAVIGAGLIGCEVAASARAMGVDVAVVDVLDGPLQRVLGPVVAPLVADLHRERGVDLRFGVSVSRTPDGTLTLSDGAALSADHVLEAIGAAPEVGWLAGSGVEVADGVTCDEHGRTSVDGVFAVGDVANWAGVRSEHWTSAGEQSDRVAAAVLGQAALPIGPAYWWSDQYDVKIQGLGAPQQEDDVDVLEWGPNRRTVAVYSRRGHVTGVVGFSAAPAVMGSRSDIAEGRDVTRVLRRLGSG